MNVVIASLFIFSNYGSGPKASSPVLSSSNSRSERGVLANEDVTSGHYVVMGVPDGPLLVE